MAWPAAVHHCARAPGEMPAASLAVWWVLRCTPSDGASKHALAGWPAACLGHDAPRTCPRTFPSRSSGPKSTPSCRSAGGGTYHGGGVGRVRDMRLACSGFCPPSVRASRQAKAHASPGTRAHSRVVCGCRGKRGEACGVRPLGRPLPLDRHLCAAGQGGWAGARRAGVGWGGREGGGSGRRLDKARGRTGWMGHSCYQQQPLPLCSHAGQP